MRRNQHFSIKYENRKAEVHTNMHIVNDWKWHTGKHTLLDHACASLSAATAGGHLLPQRYRELAALLRLLVDYTTASADPSVAAAIIEAAGPSLVYIQVLHPDSITSWALHCSSEVVMEP